MKVASLLGHADVKSTQRYAKVDLDALRDAMERLNNKY